MEWQQLEYFIAVANSEHMTKTAKELAITQPALSRSIKTLEKELGIPLFERNGRNLFLNKYGKYFYQRAKAALSEIEKGRKEIESLINPTSGVISISFLHMLGAHLVPSLLHSFKKDFPDIQFDLHQGSPHELMTLISNGDCDFGITTPDFINSHYSWHLLGKFELFLTLPLDHKWANKKNIYLEEIGDEPYIGLKSSCGVGSMIDTMFAKQQITPRTVFQADELDTVAGLVSTGFGISFLPKTISLQSFPLVWLPVTAPECEVSVGVIWKKRRFFSEVSKIFLNFVQNN
jgi:DNA-binding transcriptional LysR family regulator